ncbi:hypothetical protein PI124_g16987 [Phytophthora idaei]|nr:hypothetical protein PI124_g16987 [Phytophthora idaei]
MPMMGTKHRFLMDNCTTPSTENMLFFSLFTLTALSGTLHERGQTFFPSLDGAKLNLVGGSVAAGAVLDKLMYPVPRA